MGIRSRIRNRLKKVLGQHEPAPVQKAAPPPPSPASSPAPSPPPQKVDAAPAPKAALSEEEREKQEKVARHFERARKGVLKFVAKQPQGEAALAEMHEHSEMRYFIGHQKFSRLMEGLVGEGLVAFDSARGTATITDAGRAYIRS